MRELIFNLAKRVAKWAKQGEKRSVLSEDTAWATSSLPVNSSMTSGSLQTSIQCNVSMRPAMNGRVLELAQWEPTIRNGQKTGDGTWKHSLYIVPEGESIQDAIAVLLVTQSLK